MLPYVKREHSQETQVKENTKDIGEKSEAKILSALLDKNIIVLKPWGDNQRYDFVIEKDGKFFRIQCKTVRKSENVLKFSTKSVTTKNGKPVNVSYKGQIDYFMAFSPDTGKVYCIHVDECGIDECSFRLTEPLRKQPNQPRMAVDFELDKSVFG